MTSFLRYRAAELKEKIEEKLSQEQSIEGSYFARKENKASLSHAVQSATITSGVPKKETHIPKEFK
jgi:hypothetical protein